MNGIRAHDQRSYQPGLGLSSTLAKTCSRKHSQLICHSVVYSFNQEKFEQSSKQNTIHDRLVFGNNK